LARNLPRLEGRSLLLFRVPLIFGRADFLYPTKLKFGLCACFGVIFSSPFRLGAAVSLLFLEAFFAGCAAFFNYGSQKIMDKLVARVFAAADSGKQALVD
jgi:hypothetical protein